MCSFYDDSSLSVYEIAAHIKKSGIINDLSAPCVYMPDVQFTGYEYNEDDTNNICLPFGINENDKKYLPNLEFILINDRNTNAVSTSIKGFPIIGLFMGSISNIEHNVNLMIGTMFETDFPAKNLEPKQIFINKEGLLEVKRDESILGYKDERIMSYMITELALRFLVLHEIGHHCKGHISILLQNSQNFVLLKANDDTNSDFEIEADTFAAQKLALEFPLMFDQLIKHQNDFSEFGKNEIKLMALSFMIAAMTLPFSILYQPYYKGLKIEGTIAYREIFALMILTTELYKIDICREAAIYDLCHKTDGEIKEINGITEKPIDFQKIKASGTIDFFDFGQYIMLIFIDSKRLYYSVNRIMNQDAYIENYIRVLSTFRSIKVND